MTNLRTKLLPPLCTDEIPEVFDAEFIERCLVHQKLLRDGNSVISVEKTSLRGPEGNTGTELSRLCITYKVDQDDLPKTMVLKRTDTAHLKGPSQRDVWIERLIIYAAGLRLAKFVLTIVEKD